MLRYLTAGESHGQALVAVLEGMPAGVPLTSKEIAAELARRRLGYGRGKRMRFEEARVEVRGALGLGVLSHVVRLGAAQTRSRAVPTMADLEEIDASPVRCLDGEAEGRMVAAVDAAKAAGDTLGGVFEVVAHHLPPGLGSYVHWDRKLDARLAAALMSIQAIKGVEIGEGFAGAAKPGSRAHDAILPGAAGRPRRRTGRSGGIEGGMSTGETLRVRAAMKPLSTLVRALDTVDVRSGGKAPANLQRSDVTAVPAAAVVGEAVVALVLADALLEKTGGDSLGEVRRNLDAYLAALGAGPEA